MKKRSVAALAVAMATLALAVPAIASIDGGPYVAFVAAGQPAPPLDKFIAGDLGLIEPTWNTNSLFVVYRYLGGTGLDPAEQKVLAAVFDPPFTLLSNALAEEDWIAARAQVPDAPALDTFDVFAETGQYETFRNCNVNAFQTAIVTLQSMITKFGKASPEVKKWLAAQDIVFQNCGGTKGHPHIPEALQGGTPFEQAQRAYQISCANFYGEEFDTAINLFTAIGADKASPWRSIAPYLAARATIRKATPSGENNDPALLALAEQRLKAIDAGKAPDNVKASARGLLSFVGCRLHPDQSHLDLARALMRPGSASTLAQNLIDYRVCGNAPREDDHPSDDLDDWMEAFQSTGRSGGLSARIDAQEPPGHISHLVDKWKRADSMAWLVAALAAASGADSHAAELMAAAKRVTPGSPAYLTLEFHVDRILLQQGRAEEARDRIDAILAKRDAIGRSAYNQFALMRFKLARSPDEFLTYALRYPVAIEGNEYIDYPVAGKGFEKVSIGPEANHPLGEGPLLDSDSVESMDAWIPLNRLKHLTRNPILPPPLRAEVALSVWTRAIVLADTTTARELAPIVGGLIPELKAPLEAWLGAKPHEQRFRAALIMLRNPGTSPYVLGGLGREVSFNEKDYFRSNWWGQAAAVAPEIPPTPPAPPVVRSVPIPRYPEFLSEAERKSADREWSELSVVNGAEFLCSEALRQAEAYPNDAEVPEALYRCIGAVHLSSATSRCDALAESAFHMLHQNYPDTKWARDNHYWYRADRPYTHGAAFGR